MTTIDLSALDELHYVSTTVWPVERSAHVANDANLIHYQGHEPQFGDRFVVSKLPDYSGSRPHQFWEEQQTRIEEGVR